MFPKRQQQPQQQFIRICVLGFILGLTGVRCQDVRNGDAPKPTTTPPTAFTRGWRKDLAGLEGPSTRQDFSWTDRDNWRRLLERIAGARQHGSKDVPRYLVVAPTVVRPESVYGVVVGVLGGGEGHVDEEAGMVNVRAAISTQHDQQMAQAKAILTPGTFTTLSMLMPSEVFPGGQRVRLKVEGWRGSQVLFSNTTLVTTTPRFLSILVQMSRPVYTGGQRVDFRVVLLTTDLRPYQGPVHVHVLDTDGYVVRRWLSRFPSTGVVELGLGTPGLPKPGWWRVKVQAGEQVHSHPFFITKWFPPRFEVLVEMPFSIVAGPEGIRGRFGAFYLTYSPLSVMANITVSIKKNASLPKDPFDKIFTESVKFADGWQDFHFPLERLKRNPSDDLINAEVKVKVTVRHTFLGDLHSAHARTRIVAPKVRVRFVGPSPLVFKPGMPLTAAVGVIYEDGEPLSRHELLQSSLTITSTATLNTGATRTLPKLEASPMTLGYSTRRFWAPSNYSLAEHEAERAQVNAALVHHEAFLRYQQDGILQFTLAVPEGTVGLRVQATFRDNQTGSSVSSSERGMPVHAPHHRYIHVTTSSSVSASVGEFAIFHVRANFPMDWYRYLVMAKGVLIHSGTEKVEWTGGDVVSTLSLTVAREMSPRFTLAILHVTSEGDLLVDTIHVAVTLPTSDQVEVVMNQHKDHSKKTVEASMRASPGTHLALSCTRLPSWHAHHPSRITPAALLREALAMEPHPRPVQTVRHVSRSGEWTDRVATLTSENTAAWPLAALHLAGLTCLTDAHITSPPNAGKCDHQLGYLECGDGSCYRQSEVCDGINHCHNAADELHCLSITSEYQPRDKDEGRLQKTPELKEAEFRVSQRSWWRDLFDKAEGNWCRTNAHFGHKGYEQVRLVVPHSPSRWVVEGFAVHPHHGLTILPEQLYDSTPPLLMRLEAPSFCRRGEQVSVRIHLHNALNQTVMVMVVLAGSKDYRFVHVEGDASVSYYSPRLSTGDHQHLVTVPGGGWREVMMPLAVKRQSGRFTLMVRALSQLHTRTASHAINVKPEGARVRKHTSVLLDLKNRATVYEFLDLPLDQSPVISNSILRRFVYGSPQAAITVSGDVFGPVQRGGVVNFMKAFRGRILKSSDGLAFNFGTTVWTLHYLRLTRQLTPSTAKKTFKFLNVQLAGLLTRFRSGGFMMWHFSKPSVWVTAWVVRVVMAAQLEDWENQIYIEPRFVSSSVSYLIKHQDDQGGFHESIHYRNTSLLYTMNFKGWSDGSTSEGEEEQPLVALTALIVMVLHEALPTLTGNVHADALQAKLRAVSLLERVVEQLWDPYEVAITTYALTLVDSPEKDVAYSILQSISRKTSGGGLYWSRDEVNSNERQSQNNQRNFLLPKESDHWDSYAIESTGYGLLTMLLREGVTPRAESTVRWLTSVREWDLAFSGTVDTVVALMALAEYSYRARLREVTRMNVRVEASSSPGLVHTVVITNQSIAAIHNIKVPRPWGHVSLEAKGSGQAVAQLEMTWGVDLPRYLRKAPRKYFDLRVTETFPSSRNKSIIATRVCVRWAAEDLSASSHAAFLEVDVATGYFLSQPESNKAVRKAHAQDMPMLIDVKATPNTMYWQFTHIPGDRSRCFTYDLRRQHPVANLTQVRAAHIFELFAPEHFETTMINASSLSALDICEVCGSYQCPYCPSYSGRSSTLLPHHTMLLLFPMLPSLLIPFPQQPGILVSALLLITLFLVPSSLLVVSSSFLFHFFHQPRLLMIPNTLLLPLVLFPFLPLVPRLLNALHLQPLSLILESCHHTIFFPLFLPLLSLLSFLLLLVPHLFVFQPLFLILLLLLLLLILVVLLLFLSTRHQSKLSLSPIVCASLLLLLLPPPSSHSSYKYKGIQNTNIIPEETR